MADDPGPKTVWQVLVEEADLILQQRNRLQNSPAVGRISEDPAFLKIHQSFLDRQKEYKEYASAHTVVHTHGKDVEAKANGTPEQKGPDESQQVEETKEQKENKIRAAEEDVAKFVYAALHKANLSALSLSGGGIRSATFSLGVIEGLAQGSIDGAGEPTKLLQEIDYLSTVSGGGYIGGWFSSWVNRKDDPKADRSGVAEVIKSLNQGRLGRFDREAAPVSFLREFSNYLNPRLGVTSADTWALIANYVRNVLLNWVVLLPLIASVLVIPVVFWALLPVLDSYKQATEFWF